MRVQVAEQPVAMPAEKTPEPEEPMAGDKPMGGEEPMGSDKPTGDDKPMGSDKPTGDEQPMGSEQPMESEEPEETSPPPPPQEPEEPAGGAGGSGGCTADALELIKLVNEYRAESGLPAVPASPSLCTVGAAHAADSNANEPRAQGCNLHSWADCCYDSGHGNPSCMWDKPKELTCYQGNGYENSAMSSGMITPEQALDMWKGSPGHNSVILEQGSWSNWGAMGAGIEGGFAHLWFGKEADDCAA